MSDFVSKFTVGPAAILGMDFGTLAEGKPADITIIDTEKKFCVDASKFRSKSRNTPFNGMEFRGKAAATIVAGRFVFDEIGQ